MSGPRSGIPELAAKFHPDFVYDRLSARQPRLHTSSIDRHAAVALIVEPSEDGGWSILFIERARRDGDPWSGQIAFPGGRRETQDHDEEAVAIRETFEEIGLELSDSRRLARLDDMQGRHGGTSAGMVISCFVFALDRIAELAPNGEVASVARLPVGHLINPRNYITVDWRGQASQLFPGIAFGDRDQRVVWGLTYRFLWQFFCQLGHELPADIPSDHDRYPILAF